MTASMQKYTISDIKAANAAAGMHFFDPASMRFFRSRVERGVYSGPGGVYFITSEQFVGSDGVAAPRRYSVRRFNPATGGIETQGEFNRLATLEEARTEAKRLARG